MRDRNWPHELRSETLVSCCPILGLIIMESTTILHIQTVLSVSSAFSYFLVDLSVSDRALESDSPCLLVIRKKCLAATLVETTIGEILMNCQSDTFPGDIIIWQDATAAKPRTQVKDLVPDIACVASKKWWFSWEFVARILSKIFAGLSSWHRRQN